VALPAAAGLGSCNILGPATYLALGQEKVDAEHELQDRPTVVFVDDRRNAIPLNSQVTRRAIADGVTRELMERELVTKMISPQDAFALARQRDRDWELLSIGTLGEGVGAEQVIYIEMLTFLGSPDGIRPQLTASFTVKVVDVTARRRLFPDPASEVDARELSVMSSVQGLESYRSEQGRRELQNVLGGLVADRVAKLFYRHVPDELGTRLQRP
jgi:hypothetical protein